ncbi:MAG: ABC transporter ATP-binding protein [Bacteroidetes bacterium]|nr:MAG: ABC transporter ATP-binding protein [Bacteroidota bacterium]
MVTFTNTERADILEIRNASHTYDGGKSYILKDFNLLVEDKPDQGQFVVILGPSGCGKSTVLRYLAGLQAPTSGEVFIKEKLRTNDDRIGMVFQQYSSFPWMTVLENVEIGLKYKGVPAKERREKAMEMIQIVGLDGHHKKYAQYPSLSGGQLQRVAIARSLLVNPEIILMDEPFGALDTNTRLKMQDFLISVWEKVHPTIVLVTHDISEAVYLGDDVYIMSTAPSSIIEHVRIDLPFDRDKEIKRDKRFTELVFYLEDRMMSFDV